MRWIDTAKYSDAEHLIVNVTWTPDSDRVAYQVQNREQTWLDLNFADAVSGSTRTLFRETSKAWVADNGAPIWLKDGGFVWLSERSGFAHAYRYRADGSLAGPLTTGRWDVRTPYGVDEQTNGFYFAGTERSPIGVDIYRVSLDGSGLERLSTSDGTHAAIFNPQCTKYVDTWSDISTPPQVRLHNADGSAVRVIDSGEVPALKRLPPLDARIRPRHDERRIRAGGHGDQAAGFRSDPASIRCISTLTRARRPQRSRMRGPARPGCITSCSRNGASSCGCAITDRRAAKAWSRRGSHTSGLAKPSSLIWRSAWAG